MRREPDGDDATEVTIAYVRQLERRLADLEAFVAGKLPHDHDGRYVNESGDTMTGDLLLEDADGNTWSIATAGTGTSRRLEIANENGTARIRCFTDDWSNYWQFRGDVGSGVENLLTVDTTDGEVTVLKDFTTNGAKNAVLADPADPTRAWRWAAMEADEPGLLAHRWLNVHVDRETTLPVPEHWGRIARDPMVMVSHASEPDDTSPRAPFGWADLAAGQVTVRAPKGDYHVLLVACRSDLDGRWSHEVAVDPEADDDV